tara:strand:+ start:4911 stop:5174 length:264 start_codon:yes stop_codon:yes gene_type:complete
MFIYKLAECGLWMYLVFIGIHFAEEVSTQSDAKAPSETEAICLKSSNKLPLDGGSRSGAYLNMKNITNFRLVDPESLKEATRYLSVR